jgi:hypothetical protein
MKKTNPILKWFLIVILIMLCLELVFNFSGIIEENFDNHDAALALHGGGGLTVSETQKVQSVVSKYSGKIINVQPIGDAPTQKILINFNGNTSLTVNDDGTYTVQISNQDSVRQQWRLIAINNASEYDQYIHDNYKNSGFSTSDSQTKYPFYIIVSNFDFGSDAPKRCLQYDTGSILVRPVANYDSQKWDISYQKIESNKSIKTHMYNPMSILSPEFRTDPHLNSANEMDDSKIKINLNLDNSSLGNLLEKYSMNSPVKGMSNDSQDQVQGGIQTSGKDCPDCNTNDWLSRDKVKSVCSGCDPDDIDPV